VGPFGHVLAIDLNPGVATLAAADAARGDVPEAVIRPGL
jgi:hypothetical protein